MIAGRPDASRPNRRLERLMPPTIEDYRVQLEAYSGPLDLLLHLVKRHEIDLNDIPIAALTDQYLKHLAMIQQIDVERAGEFLVMAATLMEIKSQMLVPRPAGHDEAGPGGAKQPGRSDNGGAAETLDPRHELVQQLLAYKRFKDAAIELEQRQHDWARRLPAHPAARSKGEPCADGGADPIEIDLEDVHVLDLCKAFARILDSIGRSRDHQILYDDTPISLHAEDIFDRLKRQRAAARRSDPASTAAGSTDPAAPELAGPDPAAAQPGPAAAADCQGSLTLGQIFEGRTSRGEMIGLFLAILELVRERKIRIIQDADAREIRLELRPEFEPAQGADEKPADWRDPQTGQMRYEWPDDAARLRAEQRAKTRAERIATGRLIDEDEEQFNPDEIDLKLTDQGEVPEAL